MKENLLVVMLAVGIVSINSSPAAALAWDGGGSDGNFTNMANWVGDALPVSGSDSLVFASGGFEGQQTVNLDAPFTAFRTSGPAVLFNANTAGGKDIAITGTNTLTIDGNGSTLPVLVVQAGAGTSNVITAPVAFVNMGSNSNVTTSENLSLSSVDYPVGGSGRSFWTTAESKTLTLSLLTGVLSDINFVGNGTVVLDGSQTNSLAAMMRIDESVSGAGEQPMVIFAKSGTAKAYDGTDLRLIKGTLQLAGSNADQINDAAVMLFATPATFDLNGRSETLGGLRSFGGTFDFSDPAAESLWFQAGGTSLWSGTLNIEGFEVGMDSLRFGTTAAGLTPAQLATISFGGISAEIDSLGFVTPIPEPGSLWLFSIGGVAALVWFRRFPKKGVGMRRFLYCGASLLAISCIQAQQIVDYVISEDPSVPVPFAGVSFAFFGTPSLNNNNEYAFYATVRDTNPNDGVNYEGLEGIFGYANGTLETFAFRDDPVPVAIPGVMNPRYAAMFGKVDYNDSSQVVFGTKITGDNTGSEAILIREPGFITRVAAKGDSVPGTAAVFDSPGISIFGLPSINNSGHVAFSASITNSSAFVYGMPGNLSLFATEEQRQAVGFGPANFYTLTNEFGFLTHPLINDNGHIAFRSTVSGPGLPDPNTSGFWRGPPNAESLVVSSQSQRAGEIIEDLLDVNFSNSGHVVFSATVNGGGQPPALFTGLPSSIRLVAIKGGTAPGTDQSFGSVFRDVNVNDKAQIAFGTRLAQTFDDAVFATDISGALRLLIRGGQRINFPGVGIRTVDEVHLGSHALNNNDLVAVSVRFDESPDSYGLLVIKILPVPPSINAPGKIKTKKTKVTLKGSASFGTAKVEVSGGGGKFKAAKGTTRWSFVAAGLKKGRNKLTVRATSSNGLTATASVVVIRK